MKIPKASSLAILIIVGWLVFVLSYLALWETHPAWQTILNRISWSTADFIALAATALALYTYHLFHKGLESPVSEQIIDYLSKPENQKKLDGLLRNVLACEATGQALDIAVEYAKKKITSSLEGQAGAQIKAFRKGIKAEFPESVQKLFENKWVENAVKAVSIIDGILKTLKGGGPPGQTGEGE